ncbi:MAG TPA: hypothetical protein VNB94_06495 [Mycobacteriales bacterium]|nr:hypothetical protein [Mycobacteriales bacterium]
MTRLFQAEMRRLAARRAVRWLTLALIGVLFLIGISALRDAGKSPGPGDFVFRDRAPEGANIVGGALAVYAFLVGATYAGAEWAAGTVQALLLWEPRRVRVLLVKITALSVWVLGVGVLAHAVLTSFAAAASRSDGSYTGLDGHFWRMLLAADARALVMGVFGGALAFGIAGLTHSTGAALGAGFVYFAILEQVLRGLVRWSNPYLVGNAFVAWLNGELVIPLSSTKTVLMTRADGGLVMLGYAVVVVGVMTLLFARRDVT